MSNKTVFSIYTTETPDTMNFQSPLQISYLINEDYVIDISTGTSYPFVSFYQNRTRNTLLKIKDLFNKHSNIQTYQEWDRKRLSTKVIRSAVKELLISIGYDSKAYSVHSLRHTFATTALIEGASLLETKEALRHSDVSTTQIYAHLVEKLKSNTYQKVSDALFK